MQANVKVDFSRDTQSVWPGIPAHQFDGTLQLLALDEQFDIAKFFLPPPLDTAAGMLGITARIDTDLEFDVALNDQGQFSAGDVDISYTSDFKHQIEENAGFLDFYLTHEAVDQGQLQLNEPVVDFVLALDLGAKTILDWDLLFDSANIVGVGDLLSQAGISVRAQWADRLSIFSEDFMRDVLNWSEEDIETHTNGFTHNEMLPAIRDFYNDNGLELYAIVENDRLDMEIVLIDLQKRLAELIPDNLSEVFSQTLLDTQFLDIGLNWSGLLSGVGATGALTGEISQAVAGVSETSGPILTANLELDDYLKFAVPSIGPFLTGNYDFGTIQVDEIVVPEIATPAIRNPITGAVVVPAKTLVERQVILPEINQGLSAIWDILDLDLVATVSYFQDVDFNPADAGAVARVLFEGQEISTQVVREFDTAGDIARHALPNVDRGEVTLEIEHFLDGSLTTATGIQIDLKLVGQISDVKLLGENSTNPGNTNCGRMPFAFRSTEQTVSSNRDFGSAATSRPTRSPLTISG